MIDLEPPKTLHLYVTIQEYFEAKLQHERELRERAVEDAKQALDLQAKEYERRLNLLNGAHERTERTQARMEALYTTRDTFDGYIKHMSEWRETVNKQLDENRGASSRQTYLIGTGVALLAIALKFLTV